MPAIVVALLFLWALPATGADAATNAVTIIMRQVDGGADLIASNSLPAIVSVRLEARLRNATADRDLPLLVTVPAKSPAVVLRVRDDGSGRHWSAHWDYQFNLGDHRATPAADMVYEPPFDGRFRLTQGWNGRFSHRGNMRYAIDFTMPEGTDVRAARGGVVAQVKDGFRRGAPDPRLLDAANEILIVHEDGTIGQYTHLRPGGAKVRVGDRVQAGRIIGLSGNTGYSTRAHLHFAVLKSDGATNYQSVPFRLPAGVPREGAFYRGRR